MKQCKKAQAINALAPAVLVLVIAAIFLVMGLIMLDELGEETATESTSIFNETLTTVTGVGETVSRNSTSVCRFRSFSILSCNNVTSGEIIPTTNYSAVGTGVIKANAGIYNNTNWNCSYSYTYGGDVCTITDDTIIGVGSLAGYFDLVVLGVVISLILGLILWAFGTRTVK